VTDDRRPRREVAAWGLARSVVAPRRGQHVAFNAELLVLDHRGKIVSASVRARSVMSELDLDGHQAIGSPILPTSGPSIHRIVDGGRRPGGEWRSWRA